MSGRGNGTAYRIYRGHVHWSSRPGNVTSHFLLPVVRGENEEIVTDTSLSTSNRTLLLPWANRVGEAWAAFLRDNYRETGRMPKGERWPNSHCKFQH